MTAIEVKFSKKPRLGLISLWVNDLHIWDLDKHDCTPEVMRAIQSAVQRGMEICRNACIQPVVPYVSCDGKFEAKE